MMQTAPRAPVRVLGSLLAVAAVLSPIRRRILERLDEPGSASGLARRLGLPRQKINYHLRLLERQGLVRLVERRRRRGCTERIVRATAHAWIVNPACLGGRLAPDPEILRDRFSSAYLLASATRMMREVAVLRERATKAGKKLATMTLETEIAFETPSALNAFARDLTRQLARVAVRYNRPGGRSRQFRMVFGAHPILKQDLRG